MPTTSLCDPLGLNPTWQWPSPNILWFIFESPPRLRFTFECKQLHWNLINDKFPHERTLLVSQTESLSVSLGCCIANREDSVGVSMFTKMRIYSRIFDRKHGVYFNERLIEFYYSTEIALRFHIHKRRLNWDVINGPYNWSLIKPTKADKFIMKARVMSRSVNWFSTEMNWW